MLLADCWTLRYTLAFELELHRAESEFLTGDLAGAEERLSALAGRAANPVDQAAVTSLRADLYTVLGRPDQAVAFGLDYLRRAGFEVARHPTDGEVRQEYKQLWNRLGARAIDELIDLPLMEDPDRRATMDVLTKVVPAALTSDQNLNRLLLAHMVNLSLEYGNSGASCVGYAWFGRVLAADFGNYPAALSFGQLSLDLVDRPGLGAFKCRVYMRFGASISPWVRHIGSGRPFLLQASDEANKIGDLAYIGYCREHCITNSLASGRVLADVETEILDSIRFSLATNFKYTRNDYPIHLSLVREIRGLPVDFSVLGDHFLDGEKRRKAIEEDPNPKTFTYIYWVLRLQMSVFAEDYPSAVKAAVEAQALEWLAPAYFEQAEYHYYAALARAGSFGLADAVQQAAHLDAMAAHHRQLEAWAEHCPENFENRAALVGAEIARLEDRDLEAQHLYGQAIRSARVHGFVHNEALACEMAGRLHAARGFEDIAEMYLQRARDGYSRWGADGKVRRLEARYPGLTRSDPRDEPREGASADQQLDLAAVVKASQALSSEMQLPRLIEQLMTIALQNAGADRALLILPDQDDYRIEAEALAEGGGVAVRSGAAAEPALPHTLIRYVVRTHERVILDDAAKPNLFSEDAYLGVRRPRSVLCLPLVRQGVLGGLLYLENTLTPHVFTPERARLLELLASQASVSLQNATLYTELQRSNDYLAEAQRLSRTGSFTWDVPYSWARFRTSPKAASLRKASRGREASSPMWPGSRPSMP